MTKVIKPPVTPVAPVYNPEVNSNAEGAKLNGCDLAKNILAVFYPAEPPQTSWFVPLSDEKVRNGIIIF
jgi:hypothetical protein